MLSVGIQNNVALNKLFRIDIHRHEQTFACSCCKATRIRQDHASAYSCKKIGCPAICRNEIKEGFVNMMQSSHESLRKDVNQSIYSLFFEILDFLLTKKITLVAEVAFQHYLREPQLERLSQIS
jgi:hypothetical protein